MNKLFNYLLTISICALFATAFIVSDELVDGVWTAKTFYFYSVCTVTFTIICLNLLLRKDSLNIEFNILDISLIIFYLYNVMRLVFTEEVPLYNARIITFTFLLVLYFVFKNYFKNFDLNRITVPIFIIITFLIVGLAQACIGLFQAHNLFGYNSGYFLAFGTFGNPAPYTGFIISILPFSLGLYLLLDGKSLPSIVLKYLGFATFCATIFVLPVTKTRGGWLAAIGGIIVILIYKYKLSTKISKVLNKPNKKIVTATLALSFIVVLFFGLYQLRPASAYGRLLIWKVSTTIINEYPFFGVGYDRFGQVYNSYQGTYFAEKDRGEFEKYVAGNVKQAHNEYIETTTELGIFGLFLLMGVLSTAILGNIYLFRNSNFKALNSNLSIAALSSVVALMISGFFSYPFQILPTLLNYIFMLSILSAVGNYQVIITIEIRKLYLRISAIVLLSLLIFFSIREIRNYENYIKWNEAVALSHYQSYDEAIGIYHELYKELNYSGNFLVNYGGVLVLNGEYKKAIKVLNEGKNINSDPNLYISLGNGYKGIEKIEEAENAYEIAVNIIPHKFYPKYLLVKLHNENGESEKAKVMAQNILEMDEKISSSATYQIKEEMKIILNNKVPDEAN
jgi:O-antigen ligase